MPGSKLRFPIAGCPFSNCGLPGLHMETVGPAIEGRRFVGTKMGKCIRQKHVLPWALLHFSLYSGRMIKQLSVKALYLQYKSSSSMYLKKIMAATLALTALAGQAQEKPFNIIPEPVETTVTGQGEFQIQRNTTIRVSEPALASSATYLADYMDRYLGIPLQTEIPKTGKSRRKGKSCGRSNHSETW